MPYTLIDGDDYTIYIRGYLLATGTLSDVSDMPFKIIQVPPDLRPVDPATTGLVVPANAYANTPNKIRFDCKNYGYTMAPPSSVIRFYVDGVFAGDDKYNDNVYPNGVAVGIIDYTFSSPGQHQIRALCDATNIVPESNEDNNEMTITVNLLPLPEPIPDLRITQINTTHNYADTPNYINVIFWNKGTEVASRLLKVSLYVDGAFAGENLPYSDLIANSGQVTRFRYTFVGAGPHNIRVVADASNIVQESDETNNESVVTFNFAEQVAKMPDLLLIRISPNHNYANTPIRIIVFGQNAGDEMAPAGFVHRLYIDGAFVKDLGHYEDSPANYIANTSFEYVFTMPGRHEIKVVIDATDRVKESNESNNEMTYTIDVQTAP